MLPYPFFPLIFGGSKKHFIFLLQLKKAIPLLEIGRCLLVGS